MEVSQRRRQNGTFLFEKGKGKEKEKEKPAEKEPNSTNSTVLLDVSGMMCGACATRVKSILSADERVESAMVNMLTETATIKLKEGGGGDLDLDFDFSAVADSLAERVMACGFDARRRVSGMGVEVKVRKWRETVEKKDALLVKSRNRVAFAWMLVALCSGVGDFGLAPGISGCFTLFQTLDFSTIFVCASAPRNFASHTAFRWYSCWSW